MKQIIIITAILFLFSASNVHAAGILWRTEYVAVEEGNEKCIDYGIYNPFDPPVKAEVSLEGDIKNVTRFKFDPVFIPGNTYHTEAIDVPVCFRAEEIYKEDCLLGPLVCEKKCLEPRTTYTGSVVVTDRVVSATGEGIGSKVVVSASAPVKFDVLCTPHERDYRPLYVITIAIAIALVGLMLFRKYRTPATVRKQRKIEKLQAQLEAAKRKQK